MIDFPQPFSPADEEGRLGLLGTAAHQQTQTIRLTRAYPDHEPRAADPNYRLFETAKARMKASGQWRCAVNNADCAGGIQVHHSYIEFAYQNDVDVAALNEALGLHLADASFILWVESPGNLEPLCQAHHTGVLGVHLIPTADWEIVRVHKGGLAPIQVTRSTP
jgi:hypothetical protein